MRVLLFISLLLCVSTVTLAQKIYQSERIEDAHIKIYPVDDPSEADLLVSFVWDTDQLVKTGAWMDMPEPHLADVLIFFVDDRDQADITIWLVDTLEEVKWQNQEKEGLLTISQPDSTDSN